MLVELGQFFLILAFVIAGIQALLPLAGQALGRPQWLRVAIPAAKLQFLFILAAFVVLALSFLVLDFSVLYVATNANTHLPLIYRFSAVWGAHEGSLLLWVLILSGWTLAVAIKGRQLPHAFHARVIGVLGIVSFCFLAFILLTSNPFERLLPAALEGRDLNPLLQDPGLIIHPPMLYLGYIGFSVAFAFAIAGLLDGRLDLEWVRWARPYTNAAWAFLTLGIALGSWWAYYELGWGGWWFWDPVENASFMPWLAGTALIHAQAATEKRGAFKTWTVLLSIFTFSLSILGTFLVRSGVVTSVHAFASDPTRGVFVLGILGIICGGGLLLYAIRAPKIRETVSFDWLSRESLLLFNNVFLVSATLLVLLGTIYPILVEAFGDGKISVGEPFFHQYFPLLIAPIVLLMPFGPFSRWKKDEPKRLLQMLSIVALIAIAAASASLALLDKVVPFAVAGLFGGFWIMTGALYYAFKRLRKTKTRLFGIPAMPRAVLGMLVAHFGLGMFLIGVTMTESQSLENDIRMQPGDVHTMAIYDVRFDKVWEADGPNYRAQSGRFTVTRNGETAAIMYPQKRQYVAGGNAMTEAAIDAGFFRDLYISMGEPLGEGDAWAIRIYYKPMIRWIWLGAILMMVGGLLGATDSRYRTLHSATRKNLLAAET